MIFVRHYVSFYVKTHIVYTLYNHLVRSLLCELSTTIISLKKCKLHTKNAEITLFTVKRKNYMSAYAKKSLKKLMDDELERLGLPKEFSRLEKFINSGKKSAKFISYLLKDSQYSIPNDNDSLYETAEIRARHSAVTFLVGLALRNFGDLFNKIPAIVDHSQDCAEHMWLTTSLYHDKAYSSTYVTRPDIDYRKKFLPYLLTDNLPDEWSAINKFSIIYPGTLAYTYNEIEKYDEYAIEYHRENEKSGKEKRDHGILGGVMMFSDLENKAVKQGLTDELPIIKACSLAVAQHNIFKSSDKKSDERYIYYKLDRLLSTSPFQITQKQPLLLFLSLVDTIECVKSLSKGENSSKYLETLTVLKSIQVLIQKNTIELDFTQLEKEISKKENKELQDSFDHYLKSLKSIHTWTVFHVETDSAEKYKYRIYLAQANKTR